MGENATGATFLWGKMPQDTSGHPFCFSQVVKDYLETCLRQKGQQSSEEKHIFQLVVVRFGNFWDIAYFKVFPPCHQQKMSTILSSPCIHITIESWTQSLTCYLHAIYNLTVGI
uniref:Uncharacterized protein n=1 Tax=Picea sitchensis TaxID=3332 RepID=A9NXD9_PICSI|nr:unknown [Picea sitchensis]